MGCGQRGLGFTVYVMRSYTITIEQRIDHWVGEICDGDKKLPFGGDSAKSALASCLFFLSPDESVEAIKGRELLDLLKIIPPSYGVAEFNRSLPPSKSTTADVSVPLVAQVKRLMV